MRDAAGLDRHLTTLSATLFGLSYMTPVVVAATFGIIADRTHGDVATAYLVATAAMLLTARSYGVFARRYARAGSAYTYATQTIGPVAGFLVGWVLLLDYCFVPMVMVQLTAISLASLAPAVPLFVWVLGLAALSTLLNVLGLRVANRVNLLLMIVQLVTVGALALLCALVVVRRSHFSGLLPHPPALAAGHLVPILSGAAVACYSFLGFDAVSTLSEETMNPTRSIPRAMLIATLAGGLLFTLCAYLMALVHPTLDFANLDTAGYEIVAMIGNGLFRNVFLLVVIASFFAALLCAQASGARLMYVMGRDGILPPKVFGTLGSRSRTPVINVVVIGTIMLLAGALPTSASTSYINFGAFSAFFAVNVCVVIAYFRSRHTSRITSTTSAFAAGVAALSCALLFTSLDTLALRLGTVWTALGLAWLLVLTRVLSRPLPSACG